MDYFDFLFLGWLVGIVLFRFVLESRIKEKINQKMKERSYHEAYRLSECLSDFNLRKTNLQKEILEIYCEYQKKFSVGEISKRDLVRMIRLAGLIEIDNRKFLPIIEIAREKKDKYLLGVLSENVISDAWKKVLKNDLNKL